MNTEQITEADVLAWLRCQGQRILAANPTIRGAVIQVSACVGTSSDAYCYAHADERCGMANTVDEAIEKVLLKVGTPEQRAAEKRAEAAKLLAEAQALVATP